jgi:hypothetical protein
MKLSEHTSAKSLAKALEPHLASLDGDANLLGSVRLRVDPLLKELPKTCVLTGRTIESLGLNEHETAYLVLRQWLRSHPTAIGHGMAAESLAGALEMAAQFAKMGQFSIWPEWMRAGSFATAVDGKDPSATGLPLRINFHGGYKEHDAGVQFVALNSLAIKDNIVELEIHVEVPGFSGDPKVTLKFWPQADGWKAVDQHSRDVLSLARLPMHLLDAVHRFLMPPVVKGGLMAELRAQADQGNSQSSPVRDLCHAIEAVRRDRAAIDDAGVQAILESWKSGEPAVGAIDRETANLLARKAPPPAAAKKRR